MRIKQAEHKAAALREQAEPAKQRALKIQHVEDPTVALYIRAYSGDTTNLLWWCEVLLLHHKMFESFLVVYTSPVKYFQGKSYQAGHKV